MNLRPHPALAACLLALADDELILGHRDSEWTGHAPILEEDIAFANIAQDEIGHAILWYRLVEALTGTVPDRLVYFRDGADYRNVQLVELPKGDWAFSMLRQYLFDSAEMVRLPHLARSRYPPVADTAAKIRTEEIYHFRHTQTWIKRLGLGTPESHGRTQAALDEAWPFALQLFVPLPEEAELAAAGLVPDASAVQLEWEELVVPALGEAGLTVPASREPAALDRRHHSQHLAELLADMQTVARLEGPEVQW
jgi:ring-1,2-phenylacetyl-CoA epoxidase subunit PaaC